MQRSKIFGEAVGGLYLLKNDTSTSSPSKSPVFLNNKSSYFSSNSTVVSNVESFPCLPSTVSTSINETNFSSENATSNRLWHLRLDHLPYASLKNMHGIKLQLSKFHEFPCDICPIAKQSKLPFPTSSITSHDCFDMIYIDTWGPYKTQTYKGEKYFLTIVDDFSRTTWTYLMPTKSNAFPILKSFLAYVERQFGKKIKIVRSDNAYELGSGILPTEFFLLKGLCTKLERG